MVRKIFFLGMSVLLFTLLGCDSGVDSKDTKVKFSMLFTTSGLPKTTADSFTIKDEGGTAFTITEARCSVRHIEFDYPEGSLDSTKVRLNGPFIVDLMDGSSNPNIGSLTVEPGTYRRIDIRLDDTKSVDGLLASNDELMDNTLILKGTFDYDGNANRNFTFILKLNEDVRFESLAGIDVNEETTKNITLRLKVDEWLDSINLTECLDDGDVVLEVNGDLLINDNNGNDDCHDFEQTIKRNIKNKYDIN